MIKEIHKNSPLRRLGKYLLEYKIRLIVAILMGLISVLGLVAAPYFMGYAINFLGEIFTKNYTEEVQKLFLVFAILTTAAYCVQAIFSKIALNILVDITQKTVFNLRKEISEKLHRLPLNYYDTTTYGDILSRVTNDVNIVSDSLQSNIYIVVNAFFTIIFVLIMMFKISGVLTFVGLLSFPVLIFVSNILTKKSEKHYERQLKSTGDINGIVEEYYSGHNIVSIFGKEKFVIDKFEKENEKLFEAGFYGDFYAGSLFSINNAVNNLSYAFVVIAGVLIAIAGGLSVGMIQAFTQYMTQFSSPISEIMQIVPIVQQTSVASERIFEFLDEEEEIPDVKDSKFPKELKGAVEFDHIQFGYLPHQILIHDVCFKANAGEKVAIVGPTGAGKTTLVNLIMRFYDVNKGAIRIDGVDIRDMKRADLRKIFGMVLQDTWLYNGTILDNVRYGRLEATDEEVKKACEAARADAFIRTLPGGYKFVLSEGASNIAQGQRQLLTIARAMLADSPILILDEATSSVDTRTEKLIQEAMLNIMKGRTTFVIAHRLSTIKDSNNILYMQNGDILEVGSHDELMAKNGLYAKLYNSQFEGEET